MDGQFERTAKLWMAWSTKKFAKATSFSSLQKAEKELDELQQSLVYAIDPKHKLYEYVDVMMCLLHSAAKEGFTIEDLTNALKEKANINYKREWVLDETGNTYSHKKQPLVCPIEDVPEQGIFKLSVTADEMFVGEHFNDQAQKETKAVWMNDHTKLLIIPDGTEVIYLQTKAV